MSGHPLQRENGRLDTIKARGTEHGLWSEAAGGFIDSGIYSTDQADEIIAALVEQGEDDCDLGVLEFCHDHRDDEQPAVGCEICDDDTELEV